MQNSISTLNPATGETLAVYPFASASELEAALAQSSSAFSLWKNVPIADRASYLVRFAQVLRQYRDVLADAITQEMGKPVMQARAEVEKSAALCDWYASEGPAMLAPEPTQVDNGHAEIAYRPLGTILAVMPWNFPVWQVLRGAVPAMLAGNTFLLKPAPNVAGSTQLLLQAAAEAGLPAGVFSVINATNDGVSAAIKDDRIAAVTLTGSVRAGAAIASQAGAALKKSVMELGGADAFIVLKDANLDEAVRASLLGRFQNGGQVCAAAKRLIVEEAILPAFTEKFVAMAREMKIGDPTDEATYIGPMARYDLRDELDAQVQATLSEGATLLMGGEKIAGAGNYYAPTVLSNVTPEMTAFREELFGPVASIIAARDADHAVTLANDSDFGLSATIYTADTALAEAMTVQLECGGVFINGISASDPRVAFGGVKKSGYGRELSHFGLREFCNAQTVWRNRKG